MKRLLASVLCISLMVTSMISCKKDTEELSITEEFKNYDVTQIELPDDENEINDILMIQKAGDQIYILEESRETREAEPVRLILYSVDISGNVMGSTEIDADLVINSFRPFIWNDQLIISTAEGILSFYDLDTGIPDKHITVCNGYISYALPLDDGMIICDYEGIIRLDADGNKISAISDAETFCFDNVSLWSENGTIYGIDFDNSGIYQFDFESGKSELISDSVLKNIVIESLSGQYLIGSTSIYKAAIGQNKVARMADLGSLNVMPPRSQPCTSSWFIDEDSFIALAYRYDKGKCDIQILTEGVPKDNSGVKTITIGTIAYVDDTLKQAVYEYNNTHTDCQVEIIDYYEKGIFKIDESIEYPLAEQKAMTELISYFNDGNMPDILYGQSFDDENLGRIGIVEDLLPIMESDPDFDKDSIYGSLWNAMTRRGHCYSMVSSCSLFGYWGLSEFFEDDDVSLDELLSISKETGIRPVGGEMTHQLVQNTVTYGRYDYADNMTDGHLMTEEDMLKTVKYALEYGYTDWEDEARLKDWDIRLTDKAFLTKTSGLSIDTMTAGVSYTYVGFPSIYGSCHTVTPTLVFAICSDSDKKDVAWEFIKSTLSVDFQREYCSQLYYVMPVNKDAMEEYMAQITDKLRAGDIRRAIDSIDTINYHEDQFWNIIRDELGSYTTQNRTAEDISRSLLSRLDLYVQENY